MRTGSLTYRAYFDTLDTMMYRLDPAGNGVRLSIPFGMFFCIMVVFSFCFGCKPGTGVSNPGSSKPVMVVSILPQQWFVARIAGDRVRIMTLVGPGQNPHSYEPTPKQMAELAAAQAWVLSGTEFELPLRPKIEALFPKLRIVDGTAGVSFRSLEVHDEHGETDDASGIDRHTWLVPKPAKIMAAHIRDALCSLDEPGAPVYQENYAVLIQDIDAEFDVLQEELSPLKGTSVFVYHPSFGYFLDTFGIVQEAIELGGKEPTPRELSGLIDKARQHGAAAIFVQAQFPVQAARTAAASVGAELIALDPLALDWLQNIRDMGAALKNAATMERTKPEELP
jgi:zinc transport system substrate-binding protein